MIIVALLVVLVFAIAARGAPVPDQPDPAPITVSVSPDLDRHPISPLIFGANWGDGTPSAAQLATGFYTAARWGGNATTRYDLDTSHGAFDYFFLNINTGAGNGAAADAFASATLAADVEVVMTMPIDRVAGRAAHGDLPWPAWYMQQSCANRLPNGDLPVDWLDIHFYPQGDDVAGTWGDPAMENDEDGIQLRLHSLEELYDPNWASESWIALGTPDVVSLIPRMRGWRDQYCPEMKLAITEYKWGRDDTLAGALAQTEALAIFGREGLDMAMRWLAPEGGSLTEDAYRLYRDYDGNGGKVAGDSVRAVSNDIDRVGAYAVRAAGDELFVILINKDAAAQPATINVAGGVTGLVALWRLSAAGYAPAGSIDSTATGFALTLPARTATLARVQIDGGGGYPLVVSTAGPGSGTVNGTADGVQCFSDCAGNYPEGTAIVLYASAGPGSSFIGWSGDCTGTENCNLTMDGARTVTASFSDTNPGDHTLMVTVDGSGTVTGPQISCPGDCSETYPNSTVVALVATPAPGWRLNSWSGVCSGRGGCSVIMNDDYAAIAVFEPLPTLLVDGFESGTLDAWQH